MSDIERSSRADDSVEDAVKRALREVDTIIPQRRKRQRPPFGVLRDKDLTLRPVAEFETDTKDAQDLGSKQPNLPDPRFVRLEDASIDTSDTNDEPSALKKNSTRILREFVRGAGIAVLVLVAVTAPFFLMAVVGLWLLASVSAFLVFGAERVWIWVAKTASKLAFRFPRQGAGLFLWLDSVAYRWDLVLDRFPEGTVDGLYMPDFATCHQMLLQDRQAPKPGLRL